ncbi:hypothetical protein G6514_002908 [Epicoccum nigrum]|nr:hypothetical protein G6514_002908 [Epicoccum nigrum]
MANINNPNAKASSSFNSNQQKSQIAPNSYNSNYAQQSQLHQPSARDSGNLTSGGFELRIEPTGSFGPQPQQSRSFESQPQRYGGLTRKPVPTQSQAPVSSAGRYAVAAGAGAGGYVLPDAAGDEGDEEEKQDEHLAYDELEKEEQDEGEDGYTVEEEEAAEDEKIYDYGGHGGYSDGCDGSQYGGYR